jgi:choice-of-anchor B domain-containing protein
MLTTLPGSAVLRRITTLLLLQAGLLASAMALAHSDGTPLLYVASGGIDAGRCDQVSAPCRTISYAMRWIGKGGQIRVAGGSYAVSNAADLFQIITGDVDIQGGYRASDKFRTAGTTGSTLTGVPMEYADQLSRRGFHVVVDRKGIDRDVLIETQQLLAVHERLETSMSTAPCVGGTANGMPCDKVDLLSHVSFGSISARPHNAADVWGFVDLNSDREYAIVGFDIGTAVFDVTDAGNPREVGFIDGQMTSWRDIKVYQYWNAADGRWNADAYVTTDGSSDGLFVIDLSGLPQRIDRVPFPSEFFAAHNVYATDTDFGTGLSLDGDAPALIIAGSNIGSGPYRAYTMADPAAPAFEVMPGSGRSDYMHDAASMIITDVRKDTQCVNAGSYCEVLFDFNESTVDIWDITDSANPARLSRTGYPNRSYVHSGWWSEDRQYLFVHDELDERDFNLNTTVRIFSLADLALPSLVGTWTGPTRAIDHNGFVRGNRYYMSNYSRGLTILDISNAANPVLVGYLDTYPASDANGFVGAWGVYPYFHSGNIAISDINSGFYMGADRTLEVAAGSLAFPARSFAGSEGDLLQIPVQRNGGTSGAISVGYELVPATGGAADVQTAGGSLAWADGDGADKFIDISLLDDAAVEGLERLLIRLVAPSGGATLAAARVASIYVGEPGAAPVVEFDRDSIQTAERGFATAVAVIRRSGSAAGAASVEFSIGAGDADAGVDFQGATSGTISWAAGDADPKWLEFPIVDDGLGESTEYFELALGAPSGATVGAQDVLRINIANGSGVNSVPNAVAGSGQSVASGAVVTLDGSQSNDPDGDALDYQWTQLSGTVVSLNGADSAIATFTAPAVSSDTMLRFRLTVSDNSGLSSSSTTTITVRKNGGGGGSKKGGGGLGWMSLLILLVIRCCGQRPGTISRRGDS